MPEEEPRDNRKRDIEAEKCVTFILDNFDNIICVFRKVVAFLDTVKYGLLDNSLKELT